MLVSGTTLPLPVLRRGKVRDVYEVDSERVLLVATDRVSAFDVVMNEAIPEKGVVLTQITAWWLTQLGSLLRHHMITADAADIVEEIPSLGPHAAEIEGRVMLCQRAEVFPIECVVRAYISGSGWKEYEAKGTLAGERIAPGLKESEKLAAPVFSPATKAEEGHDENISVTRMGELIGVDAAFELERLARMVYEFGSKVTADRGIIIADTKLEFGYTEGAPRRGEFDPSRVILVDEVLTPDSSRFWPVDRYASGRAQPGLDKQPLRDYLDSERVAGRWNGGYPPPPLPHDVVAATSDRYIDIYRRLTMVSPDTGRMK